MKRRVQSPSIIPPQRWRCPRCGRFGRKGAMVNGKTLCLVCEAEGWRVSPLTGHYYRAKLTGKFTITVTRS